ncbi:ferredoxin-dependent Sulfite reductase [Halomicronema hongdechloris C2206]|uniref:Sulfite reductase [ferredoxin] n=1 Tax=Halomicronema hongdechloris C2206 TaxID=1641165 RepID=A0A1Z3HH70_9CYAN|nr:sulfite reductase, ferredoxin dependent [Halomicronema hongdechloris]ASC69641.1 ferredoxin-dependent Sulfite reductase [Halomicronema hongdechloris C2206]
MVYSPTSTTSNSSSAPYRQQKTSKLEGIKERSRYLREPVATELLQDTTHFSKDGLQILKFHGSYQQDNRDNRVRGQEKDYQFMLRTRNPGGYIPPQLYLTLDRLSEEYGNHTLRATTRQGFQLHGVLKRNLKATIAAIIRSLGSTLGACGDLNRNVMASPAPFAHRPDYRIARDYAERIADLLRPQTEAYYEIWLDGEKAITAEEHPEVVAARQRNGHGTLVHGSQEPIYGAYYMPRKFKCAVTVPGDNSVDVYTHDVTLVVIVDAAGELQGFNILAGGGMGRTHNKEETFARLADPIGYVDKADVYDALKAIVATQRDYGDRFQRRHARMKYLLHDWGVEHFRRQVEAYFGKPLQPFKPLPEWRFYDYLGWHEQGDGALFVGIPIENGRILDRDTLTLKSALREIIQRFQVPMRVTPNQSVILYDIDPAARAEIQQILSRHGVRSEAELDPLVRYSMACPALPTCGLAITESERIIPKVLERIQQLLIQVGLQDEHFVVRMTGCPNGCARPYMAELGLVGSGPNQYQLWLGGAPDQTRLARPFIDRLHLDELEGALEPLLVCFRETRQAGESFGSFCDRIGFDALQQFSDSYDPSQYTRERKSRHRIGITDSVYRQLKAASQQQGRPMSQIAAEALSAYLN